MNKNIIKNTLKAQSLKVCILAENFRKEIKGVAAVEFAFLAPLMLLMYLGTLEISNAVSANRKLSRSAYTLGDLITQHTSANSCISQSELGNIVEISDDIMFPYKHVLKITITGIDVLDGDNKVAWSETYNGGESFAENSSYATLPSQITTSDGFIVAARIKMDYTPYFGFAGFGTDDNLQFDSSAIPMQEELFLRPRVLDELKIC